MKEEVNNIEDLEKLAKLASNGNPLAAIILLASLVDEANKKDKKALADGNKVDATSIEKEKALTEELLKKDEKIKRLYKIISEKDDEIAKLKSEVEKLRLMTAPPVTSKAEERYKKLEEQIADLRRLLEKDKNPLNYWRYTPGDGGTMLFGNGGTTTSDSVVK